MVPKKPKKDIQKKTRNRMITLVIVCIALLLGMALLVSGAMNYRILRVRCSVNFTRDEDYVVREIIIATEVNDPQDSTGKDVWYYKAIGGAYNFLDFEEGLNVSEAKEEFLEDYYERLLLESDIDSIFILFVLIPKTDINQTLLLVSEEISLGISTDIQLDGIDWSSDEVDYKSTDLSANFLWEALFNIV